MPVRHILIDADSAHETALKNIEGAVVAAIAQRVAPLAASPKNRIAFARDAKTLLRDETLDAAIIGGTVKSRAESVRLCAERNLALLLEAPFALDRAATTRINATLGQTRVLCVPILPLRHSLALLHARKLLARNPAAHFHFSLARIDGNAALFHALDTLQMLGGELRRINCIAAPATSFALSAELVSGATATIFARAAVAKNNFEEDFVLDIETRDGQIQASARRVQFRGTTQATTWEFADDAMLALHRAFDEAVRSGKKTALLSTWPGALQTQNAWLAAIASAKNGKTTRI